MKYLFFLLMICALQAKSYSQTNNEVCGLKCQANKATAELNKKPFVPATTAVPSDSALPLNHLKVLSLLQKLQKILKEKEDVTLPEFAPDRPLRPSDKDDNIPALRQILQSLGYLEKATDSPFFDTELEAAVKAFQAGHCIEPDGIIGDETKARINWSYEKRLKKIDASIAKIKNLVFTDRTVIVNIPTYTLHAFEDQKLKMCMKVIIGMPKRPTPQMTSYINGVEYNPVWVVPSTILFEDKLPKIQEDSEFFEKNDLQVFDHDENEVDPSTVEWNDVDIHDFPYVFKQKSGKKNALGLLKFNLQNDDLIYIHDTPQQELFKKYSRALSSGCVRLEKAGKFASWLLNLEKDEVRTEIDTGETKTESLESPITVHITYIPVWVDERQGDGKVLWGDDPYSLEPKPFY